MATREHVTAVRAALLQGGVIPAHPLALTRNGKLDERRQLALTRYYGDAGAAGVAVGVHTTQFAVRKRGIDLYGPVLSLASDVIRRRKQTGRFTAIAGVVGDTRQAVHEATVARTLCYDAVLLSLGGLSDWTDTALIRHARIVGEVLPIVGFYLQPAVGGRQLSYHFWRRFAELESLVAIKVAPFDRYATIDVVRAVAESGRGREIALYTGNDDAIVADLTTPYWLRDDRGEWTTIRMSGGLLGHWAYWTRQAVQLVDRCREAVDVVPADVLAFAAATTDANAAIFDAANGYRGCIPGINEVLRRQGLLATTRCLDGREQLSPGQRREIDRVLAAYPFLNDDAFVAENLDRWLDH
ncbi:MAG: dihydrodipicolinate synthase family protein [Gemmatimonadales bacterium]